jgi:hypothetical protein
MSPFAQSSGSHYSASAFRHFEPQGEKPLSSVSSEVPHFVRNDIQGTRNFDHDPERGFKPEPAPFPDTGTPVRGRSPGMNPLSTHY